jgi:signal transduction histidine kinase
MVLSPVMLFRQQPFALPNEDIAELNQTRQRLIMMMLILGYTLVLGSYWSPQPGIEPWAVPIILYAGFFCPMALLLFLWTRAKPGHYPIRRLAEMGGDYTALAYCIVIEPVIMMPLYTVILWIAMGYGLRYGRLYLSLAMMFSLVAMMVGLLAIPPDIPIGTPYFALTLLLMAVAIPQYASRLLARSENARQEAEEANLAKSRFLAQASHDLRQPLHAISLFIVSLQQSGLNDAQRLIVDRIDRSLQGVGRLFRSLLDISTLDSGAMQPHPEPVPIGEVLQEIVLQNAQLAEWNKIELNWVDSDKIVLTDRAILTTMVQNLLSNALKFSHGRAVLVGCRRRGQGLAIQVWDQGVGIAAEHLPRIFDEFYQVKQRGDKDRQGVGLGLSIVARMATLAGWTVEAQSRSGTGSCFTIAGLELLPERVKRGLDSPARAEWSPLQGMRILLVEDDEDVLAATANLLRVWQCEVQAVTHKPDSVFACDLIITDFDLGGGTTGSDCISAVRKMLGNDVPAIVVTGHDDNRIACEIDDPAIPVLRKPLRPAELRSAIGAIWASRRADGSAA